jgi:uncharacterized protein YdaU (DUF1376 family)
MHQRFECGVVYLYIQCYSNSHEEEEPKMKQSVSTTICSRNYAITLYQTTWHNKRITKELQAGKTTTKNRHAQETKGRTSMTKRNQKKEQQSP